jgi:hypothetical protein
MPFTFSHPAIIFPLRYLPKRCISMMGLIVGSMVPDFEYFIRMKVKSLYSHTWLGLFWFDLPLGLLLVIVYQIFVKDHLIDNLPTALNRRFSNYKTTIQNRYSLQYLLVIALCVLLGAISHILWDGFTHPSGYFVMRISALSTSIQIGGHLLFVYKIIQHASTVIGATLILITVYGLPLDPCIKKSYRRNGFWFQVVSVVLTILIIRLITGLRFHQYGDIVVTAIAGGLLGLMAASISTRSYKANATDLN